MLVVPEHPDGAVAVGERADETVGVEAVGPVHHQKVHGALPEGIQVFGAVGRGNELEFQLMLVGEFPEDDLVHADGKPADGFPFQVNDAAERLRGILQGGMPGGEGRGDGRCDHEQGNQQIFPEGMHGINGFRFCGRLRLLGRKRPGQTSCGCSPGTDRTAR